MEASRAHDKNGKLIGPMEHNMSTLPWGWLNWIGIYLFLWTFWLGLPAWLLLGIETIRRSLKAARASHEHSYARSIGPWVYAFSRFFALGSFLVFAPFGLMCFIIEIQKVFGLPQLTSSDFLTTGYLMLLCISAVVLGVRTLKLDGRLPYEGKLEQTARSTSTYALVHHVAGYLLLVGACFHPWHAAYNPSEGWPILSLPIFVPAAIHAWIWRRRCQTLRP